MAHIEYEKRSRCFRGALFGRPTPRQSPVKIFYFATYLQTQGFYLCKTCRARSKCSESNNKTCRGSRLRHSCVCRCSQVTSIFAMLTDECPPCNRCVRYLRRTSSIRWTKTCWTPLRSRSVWLVWPWSHDIRTKARSIPRHLEIYIIGGKI